MAGAPSVARTLGLARQLNKAAALRETLPGMSREANGETFGDGSGQDGYEDEAAGIYEEEAFTDPAFEESFSESDDLKFPGQTSADPTSRGKVGLADVFNVDMNVMGGLQKYNEQAEKSDFLLAAESGGKRQRPWSEKMTFYTGTGVLAGGTLGGLFGMYDGYTKAQGSSRRIVINSVANQVGMWGTKASNRLGVAALMYSTLGWFSTYAREEDDHLNSLGVAAATGVILSTGSPQARAIYAGVTAGSLSAVNYLDVWNRVRMQQTYSRRGNRFNRHTG